MDLQKLRSTREGHRRVIQQQLAKVEEAKGKSTLTEFHAFLEILTAKEETSNAQPTDSGANRRNGH